VRRALQAFFDSVASQIFGSSLCGTDICALCTMTSPDEWGVRMRYAALERMPQDAAFDRLQADYHYF
jgi:hypothetical protein